MTRTDFVVWALFLLIVKNIVLCLHYVTRKPNTALPLDVWSSWKSICLSLKKSFLFNLRSEMDSVVCISLVCRMELTQRPAYIVSRCVYPIAYLYIFKESLKRILEDKFISSLSQFRRAGCWTKLWFNHTHKIDVNPCYETLLLTLLW